MITGATRVAGVIGWPVEHSSSPLIHNAAYAAAGLDWVYVALPVPPGRAGTAVRALPDLGIAGINVTMPHKIAAAAACDERSDVVARLGAANTVVVRDGRTIAHSTDGQGFLRSLADAGLDPSGETVLVLGAGGASIAVVDALVAHGALVSVAARRRDAADALAAAVPGATAVPWPTGPAATSVVVNATPVGMAGDPGLPVAPVAGQWAVDLVYHPHVTPWLRRAAAVGAPHIGGLGMLVHQAAIAWELITGLPAPLAAMKAAAGSID